MSVGPSFQGIFFVVRNADGVTWDVMDTRAKTIVANFPIQPQARDDAVSRNAIVQGGG